MCRIHIAVIPCKCVRESPEAKRILHIDGNGVNQDLARQTEWCNFRVPIYVYTAVLGRGCLSDSINLYAPESGNEQPESSPPAQSVPPQVSTLRKIFVGSDGLRAGWSLLIFVLITGVLLRAVGFIANKMHLLPPKGTSVGEISPGFGFLAEIIPFIVIFVATWIMSRIEKRPNSIYGLGGPRAVPLFFSGLAWGVTCLSLLVFTLWKSGFLVIDGRLLFGAEALRYGVIWLLGFLLVGLLEEYLNRGYTLFTLSRGFAGLYLWMFKMRQQSFRLLDSSASPLHSFRSWPQAKPR